MTFSHPLRLLALAALFPLAASANLLVLSQPEAWTTGDSLPRPWQHSDRDSEISVQVVELDGQRWIHFVDGSPTSSANLRQEFPQMTAGRFTFRIRLHADHIGEIGVYLGQGNASAPLERVVDLKSNPQGLMRIGSVGERINSALMLAPGREEHVYVEFEPTGVSGRDLAIRVGRIVADGRDILLGQTVAPQQAFPVSRLRITTDNAPVGGNFYVTDLSLTPLPSSN